jgi:hypothetical protein
MARLLPCFSYLQYIEKKQEEGDTISNNNLCAKPLSAFPPWKAE